MMPDHRGDDGALWLVELRQHDKHPFQLHLLAESLKFGPGAGAASAVLYP